MAIFAETKKNKKMIKLSGNTVHYHKWPLERKTKGLDGPASLGQ